MSHVDGIKKMSKVLKPVSEGQDADAAVVLLLKRVDQDLKVLFVKRAENPADPWSGQMAFPGGKRDEKDQNLKQTLVRETLEETNINLLDRCRFLGVMETLRSKRRPEMKILPFVVLLEHEPSIKLNEEL
ncbi:MAG: CoA pyrophosphatase, partial [Candidatus Bathyarchaeia archaeon]